MNAARALRVARHRAGLTQTELARRAGVPPPVVNRIERAKVVPRVDTLERLLMAAGATLSVDHRVGTEIPREETRALLRLRPRGRLPSPLLETLDELCRRRLRFVVVGDAAARLHGAPVEVHGLEIVPARDGFDMAKLTKVLASPGVRDVIALTNAPVPDLWSTPEELSWLPNPRMRILGRWIDAPGGYLASLDVLIRRADPKRWVLLRTVQEEIDALNLGFRIYRDPERSCLSLPNPPRRYRRTQGHHRGTRTNEQT